MPEDKMNKCIDDAVRMASELGIHGKQVTPFLLDKIKTLTEGKSLEANIKLVLNNAKLGAEVAQELCRENAEG